MRIAPDDIRKAIKMLKAATGPLEHRQALEVHLLGYGRLTEFVPRTDRDEFGGWALTYQMDLFGGGRQKCTMQEDRLPDRSLDAATGFAETLFPDQLPDLLRSALRAMKRNGETDRATLPRRLLLATLTRLKRDQGAAQPAAAR